MIRPEMFHDLNPHPRLLMGPGPSMVHPRVLQAMAIPTVGHLDPDFLKVMDDIKSLLRYIFQTENEFILPVSGTGSAGMEAAVCNFVEPGDPVLVAIKGYFGERIAEMACRYGAKVDRLERSWGEVFDPAEIESALKKKSYKFVALVHVETSTGVLQPHLDKICDIVHRYGSLLVLDTVASLGGVPVKIDDWGVDVCYSGSQKCLSAPPGLAPITLSQRALNVLQSRRSKVTSWYLDLIALDQYWGEGKRVYHHTAPVNLLYALREALRLALEEGLDRQFKRHRVLAEGLWCGLERLGIPPLIQRDFRSPTLTTAKLPGGLDELSVRNCLLSEFNIEIAGGFGPLAGKIWRIGLMGHSARKENVTLLLAALSEVLKKSDF